MPIIGALSLVGLFAWLVQGKHFDVLQPAGQVASKQLNILMFTVFLSAVVVIPVFTLLIYFSIKYREGNKKARYDPDWGENKWLEGLWWGIPIAIIGVLGVLAYQTSHSLDPYKKLAGENAIEVQVVTLQWKWLFIYPQYKVASLNYMPVEINRPVHFSLTAEAPMSSFWIPSLGSQVYTMNGMESQLNLNATKLGEYTGYNTNINGEGYAKMTFKAHVFSKDDFAFWAASALRSKNQLDMDAYEKLAKPKSVSATRTYALANDKLFDTIVERNMSHKETMTMEHAR